MIPLERCNAESREQERACARYFDFRFVLEVLRHSHTFDIYTGCMACIQAGLRGLPVSVPGKAHSAYLNGIIFREHARAILGPLEAAVLMPKIALRGTEGLPSRQKPRAGDWAAVSHRFRG